MHAGPKKEGGKLESGTWKRVATYVNERLRESGLAVNYDQCQQRYNAQVDPALAQCKGKENPWTEDEVKDDSPWRFAPSVYSTFSLSIPSSYTVTILLVYTTTTNVINLYRHLLCLVLSSHLPTYIFLRICSSSLRFDVCHFDAGML